MNLLNTSARVTADVVAVLRESSSRSRTLAPRTVPSRYSSQANASTTYLVVALHLIIGFEGADSSGGSEVALPYLPNFHVHRLPRFDALLFPDSASCRDHTYSASVRYFCMC